MKVLVTCPPMLGVLDRFSGRFDELGWKVTAPEVTQTLSEDELVNKIPRFDGWIAGDDPVSRRVLTAGKAGSLKAVIKWGVGVDNVDFEAAKEIGIPVTNIPGVFGEEVADLALGYMIALARRFVEIDRSVRSGGWAKPQGISLQGRIVAVAGFGNIGRAAARRFLMLGMHVIVYDPNYTEQEDLLVDHRYWPDGLDEADFLVLTCPLTTDTHHMVNHDSLAAMKRGIRIINVARGPLIDEEALVSGLKDKTVSGAALDVFEHEPLDFGSELLRFEQCVFGSHNASNTYDAVVRATEKTVGLLAKSLGGQE